MYHNSKYDKEKKLRKLWNEYKESWALRKNHGKWVKVDPYQRGWIRRFDLREDIKNREDSPYIREALTFINNTLFCRERDFLQYNYRTKKMVPMEQKIGTVSPVQYDGFDEKMKSYFVRKDVLHIFQPFTKKMWTTRYEFKYDFWFEYVIEPNIIEYQWVPDPDWETHIAELEHRIERENLWPKINKMLGVSAHSPEDYEGPYFKNKYGEVNIDDES